jgi:hypothetical protein
MYLEEERERLVGVTTSNRVKQHDFTIIQPLLQTTSALIAPEVKLAEFDTLLTDEAKRLVPDRKAFPPLIETPSMLRNLATIIDVCFIHSSLSLAG